MGHIQEASPRKTTEIPPGVFGELPGTKGLGKGPTVVEEAHLIEKIPTAHPHLSFVVRTPLAELASIRDAQNQITPKTETVPSNDELRDQQLTKSSRFFDKAQKPFKYAAGLIAGITGAGATSAVLAQEATPPEQPAYVQSSEVSPKLFEEQHPTGNAAFTKTWNRTDLPVQNGDVSRTWMWGPGRTVVIREKYTQAPGGYRDVQYFDKSRMEITDPSGNQDTPWYTTNGLLVVELMTGKLQVGDNDFEQRAGAQVNVAGDPGSDGVTYATFNNPDILKKVGQKFSDEKVTQVLHPNGTITEDPSLAQYDVIYKDWRPETEHNIASPFYDFMNSTGKVYENGELVDDAIFETLLYATGLPISEAYWTNVDIGGVSTRVLVQAFERRVLTYNPGNPDGWQVEAGNVGLHYLKWRYPNGIEEPPPDCEVTPPFAQKEFTSANGLVTVINMGCESGIDNSDDLVNNIDAIGEAIERFGEVINGKPLKVIYKFWDRPEQVPVPDENALYDPEIKDRDVYPEVQENSKYYVSFDPETNTLIYERSIVRGLSPENREKYTRGIVSSMLRVTQQKGDPLAGWSDEFGIEVLGPLAMIPYSSGLYNFPIQVHFPEE
ncbi:MAG TPA: hypothetical protein VJC10_02070 [Patescibacteria group bacterium]|nr:hypothetical protein [Patescibacteria group bacterium]